MSSLNVSAAPACKISTLPASPAFQGKTQFRLRQDKTTYVGPISVQAAGTISVEHSYRVP